MSEAPAISSKKQSVSLIFAAILGVWLVLFEIAVVFARRWLSLLLPGPTSIYIAVMVFLSVAAWLLTWAYVVRINRIERDGCDDHQSGIDE